MNNQLAFTEVYSFGCERVGKGIVELLQSSLIQHVGKEVSV